MIRVTILASTLLVSGCISLFPDPPPPPVIYALEAGNVERASGAPIEAVVAITAPNGERSILGNDVIWRTGDQLAYVSQMQWSNRAEFALQSMLIETVQRQGRFTAATRYGETRANYELRWDLLDFEVREDGMQARFVADVRLVALPGRRVVASERIEASAPVSDRASSVAAQALTRAAREGSARIGMFAADAAARDLETQAAASN